MLKRRPFPSAALAGASVDSAAGLAAGGSADSPGLLFGVGPDAGCDDDEAGRAALPIVAVSSLAVSSLAVASLAVASTAASSVAVLARGCPQDAIALNSSSIVTLERRTLM